jgi:hypothetical protein
MYVGSFLSPTYSTAFKALRTLSRAFLSEMFATKASIA